MRKIVSFLTLLMITTLAMSQIRPITGRVLDQAGQPVSGASITIRGSKTGAAADANGDFSINAKNGDVLVVSSVGIPSQEVRVGSSGNVTVTMTRQGQNLSEVVVTALGIRRNRNQVAYSAQQVGGEEVSKTRGGNFINNLSGKVSGLEIRQNNTMGGSTNVVLRGYKSLTGNNQALFVIDGVPIDNANNNTTDQVTGRGGFDYGNAAADINPDNIESMTVLKGPAATALYGSRGNNGVILINTKKGKRGLGITINSGIIRNSIIRSTFPKYQTKYGGGYGQVFRQFDVDGDGTPDDVVRHGDDASWGPKFEGQMVYTWESFDESNANFGKKVPWVAAQNDPSSFFEEPLSFNNSVFLETGNEKGSLALGYTRNNERGVLPNSKLNKDLISLTTSYNITDKLTAGAAANFSKIDGFGRFGTGYDGANALNLMTNFRQWWQVNADMEKQKEAYLNTGKNITWNMLRGYNGQTQPLYWDNPYYSRYESYETDTRNRYFGNVYLNYKPFTWLNILGRVSRDAYSEIAQERKAVTTVGTPYYRRFTQDFNEMNYDLIATSDWNLAEGLNLKGLLGSNIRTSVRSSIDAYSNGGLVIPKLYTITNSKNAAAVTENFGERRVEGYFAGATFSYKNTYTLDATIRRDRSSTLPKDNNVYYYPSVSAGFIFSQLAKTSWLSYGKLRISYAGVGNDAPLNSINDVYVHELDANSGNEVTNFNGISLFSIPGTKNNPHLKPEKTTSFDLGLEVQMFKNRFGFDIAWYKAKTIDQILPINVSTATGYSRRYVNSGTIQNTGIELTMNGTPLKTRDFSWDINLNWTRNRNKVTELFGDIDNIILSTFQGSITVNATLNEPYGTIHGTDYIYTGGQKTVDANGGYLITPSNNITIGNINPDWIGGINNRFTYKGLSISALIDMRQGGSVFSTDMYYGLAGGLFQETAEGNIREPLADGGGIIREGVFEDGKPNNVRVSLNDADQGSFGSYGLYDSYISAPDKRFVYDATYIKLREVTIGYSLPARLLGNKRVIKGIDVSLIGRNLAILKKNIPYADPEEGFSSGNYQGVQTGAYPAVRTMGVNVKFKF